MLGIYPEVNQVDSHPKEMIHMFVTSAELVGTF